MRWTYTIALLAVLLIGTSLKPEEEAKDKGSFTATVDGKTFVPREDQSLKGILVSKTSSMDGRTPARTIISTTINGKSYDKTDGKPFNESVQFELAYEAEKLGEPALFAMALQFNSTDFSMIKEQSHIKITQFTWETDHKHFRMWADFDCKMRSWGYP
ncbi:MAG: hypothetical protein JWO06_603, partial [Bacteroidota bacterium]|nr:hypothetical protein [Bacteroidota bacterium]